MWARKRHSERLPDEHWPSSRSLTVSAEQEHMTRISKHSGRKKRALERKRELFKIRL